MIGGVGYRTMTDRNLISKLTKCNIHILFRYFITRNSTYLSKDDLRSIQDEIVKRNPDIRIDKITFRKIVNRSRELYNLYEGMHELQLTNYSTKLQELCKSTENMNFYASKLQPRMKSFSQQQERRNSAMDTNTKTMDQSTIVPSSMDQSTFHSSEEINIMKLISEDQKRFIISYIKAKDHKFTVSTICRELEKKLKIPFLILKNIVKKLQRGKVTLRHKKIVSRFINQQIEQSLKVTPIRHQTTSSNTIDLAADSDTLVSFQFASSTPASPSASPSIPLLTSYYEMKEVFDQLEKNIPTYCNNLKEIMHGCSRDQIYELLRRCIHKHRKQIISRESKHHIDIFINSNYDRRMDLSSLRDKFLEQFPNFPASSSQLLALLKNSLHNISREMISVEDKEFIRQTLIEQNFYSNGEVENLSAICDYLQSKINLPRKIIYDTVTVMKNNYFRKEFLQSHKLELQEIIDDSIHAMNKNLSKNEKISIVCDRILQEEKFENIPRSILYEHVSRSVKKIEKCPITLAQKSYIQTFITENLETGIDASSFCEQLLKTQICHNIPRDQLYQIVYRCINRSKTKIITDTQLNRIKQAVVENGTKVKVMEIVNSLSELNIPTRQLYFQVYQQQRRLERQRVTLHHRNVIKCTVSEYILNEQKLSNSKAALRIHTSILVDMVRLEIEDLSPTQLRALIRRELNLQLKYFENV